MAINGIKDKAAIVGIGQTEFSRHSGRSELHLALEASKAALEDAGLTSKDIDGIVKPTSETSREVDIMNNLGIPYLRFFAEVAYGGGAPCGTVALAAMAVATGQANCILVFRALNGASATRYGHPEALARVAGQWAYDRPFGLSTAAHELAMTARRMMHEHGVTSRQFGAVAVACRKHALRNPRAYFYGKPLTIEEHQASRMVADPLRLYDCCLETDGACALIVTSSERARNLKQRPAYIMAAAQGMSYPMELMTPFNCPTMTTGEETSRVAETVFRSAGITPKDIDVAQIYDHFTSNVIMAIEDLGFCKKGEGGPFVEGGRIEQGGELPINTSGGNLSEGFIHGYTHVLEGVRQVRGTSTAQVKDAEFCLVASANLLPTSALILRR